MLTSGGSLVKGMQELSVYCWQIFCQSEINKMFRKMKIMVEVKLIEASDPVSSKSYPFIN